MKRAINFILRLAIAAGIVVGIIFGVSYLIQPKFDATKIAKADSEYNLVEKINKSYGGYTKVDGDTSIEIKTIEYIMPDAPAYYYGNTKTDTLPASKKVSDVLIVYYQYYVSASGYIKVADNNYQGTIINKMEKLKKQVNKTIDYIESVDFYAKNKYYNGYSNDNEFFARVDNWVKSYQKQTSMLIKLVEDLRSYVCKTNYKTSKDVYKYAGEIKLEVMKDYAKALFKDELNGKLKTTASLGPILKDSTDSGFLAVYDKFMSKVENVTSPNLIFLFNDSNKVAELTLLNDFNDGGYGSISSILLYNSNFDALGGNQEVRRAGFFQLSESQESDSHKKTKYFYIYSDHTYNGNLTPEAGTLLRNFVDQYYGEDVEANTSQYFRAEKQFLLLNALYNLLAGSSF